MTKILYLVPDQSIRHVADITVVETPITGFDIIRSVQEATKYGKKIALIAFSKVLRP